MYMKMILFLDGVSPDNLYTCFLPENMMKWNSQIPHLEIVEEHFNDQAVIVYQHMAKIPIPMFDQRDMVYKVQARKNYFLSSVGGSSIHVIGRESVEHANYPAGA